MKHTVFLAIALATFAGFAGAQSSSPIGKWATPEDRSIVEIAPCGDKLCGSVLSLKEPNAPDGKPKTDRNNPDPAKRDRPIIGLQLLSGFAAGGPTEWTGGTIYNPEDGQTYSCIMTLDGTKLNVKGYVGAPIFGKTQTWTRAAG